MQKRTILTQPQKDAIHHDDGPCRVLAGPGSGKTMVLTHRLARIVEEHGIPASRILAITFTKKAGDEMRKRTEAILRTTFRRGDHWIGTMHSSFRSILTEEWGDDAKLLDGRDRIRVILEITKKSGLTYLNELNPKDILALIDRWRIEMMGPEEAHEFVKAELVEQELGHIAELPMKPMAYQVPQTEGELTALAYRQATGAYYHYQRTKKTRGWIDFTDMIYETWRLLQSSDRLLEKWRGRWDYVLVDEFQDIDPCQYAIVKMLASEHRNIFIVGDDDQAIYGFRGARPDIFVRFDQEFEGTKTINLGRNFRCPDEVVQLASRMIAKNKERLEKEFVGEECEADIQFTRPIDPDNEAFEIVEDIKDLNPDGVPFNEMVIVYRTNAASLPFETQLMGAEIPYIVRNGGCFYDLKEVAPLIEYLQIALGRGDVTSIMAVANKPNRFISKKTLKEWRKESGTIDGLTSVDAEAHQERNLAGLQEDLRAFRIWGQDTDLGTLELLVLIMRQTDYEEWARKARGLTGSADSDLKSTFTQLLAAAAKEPDPSKFLRVVQRTREFARKKDRSDDAVLLSTFHGVKGLEYEAVFLTGMCEGTMPHEKAVANGKVGEERRLAHVGWTRTKRVVHVSSPASEGPPSRFVLEWQGITEERRPTTSPGTPQPASEL